MEELIKDILYYSVLISGSMIFICLLIAGLIRSFCLMLDHLKVANAMREALQLYIKEKRKTKKAKPNSVAFNTSKNNE